MSIVAPAGYGKTTLLRQWADHVSNFGYVALEDRDNDPVELISVIATALDGVEPLDPALLRMLASPGRSLESTLLPGLVEAIWARRTPTVLMLDDAHHVAQPVSLDVIAFLMLRLPPTLRLAVAARQMLPLPYARLRSTGHLLELGPRSWHWTRRMRTRWRQRSAYQISRRADRRPTDQDRGMAGGDLPRSALLRDRSARRRSRAVGLRGTEASIADYMRSELLEPLDADTRTWLRRSSVLDTMSGPLCDAALGTAGSLTRLRRLERDNLFVVALDAHRGAYRYHRLFRDLLSDELDEHEPGAAAAMSSRAAAWCAANGERERAVRVRARLRRHGPRCPTRPVLHVPIALVWPHRNRRSVARLVRPRRRAGAPRCAGTDRWMGTGDGRKDARSETMAQERGAVGRRQPDARRCDQGFVGRGSPRLPGPSRPGDARVGCARRARRDPGRQSIPSGGVDPRGVRRHRRRHTGARRRPVRRGRAGRRGSACDPWPLTCAR